MDNRWINVARKVIHIMRTVGRREVHRVRSPEIDDKILINMAVLKLCTAINVLNNYSNLIISNNY